MRLDKLFELRSRTAVGQRAARLNIGYQHLFVGTKNLGRLAHKVHAAQHNDVGIGLGRPLRQRQAVAHMVGYVLYFARLVIVRQHDRIFLLLQFLDFNNYIFHNYFI